jgi:hypothetical protein
MKGENMRVRLSRKDQFDRELINQVKIGTVFSADWYKSLCNPVAKKLFRKLQRHEWKLMPLSTKNGRSFKVVTEIDIAPNEVSKTMTNDGNNKSDSFNIRIDP